MLNFAMYIIGCCLFVMMLKLVKSQNLWERLLSLNLVAALIIMLVIIYAVETNRILAMDIAITYSIVGFLSLILMIRFILGGKYGR
ncbi:MAG: hypothetical protein JXR88_05320 [Clostridia bacterium]|nr:hypothetical protein [Clostridia bacterium]